MTVFIGAFECPFVVFPPSRHVSRKLCVFIDWIVELMAQHAPMIQPIREAGE